MTEGITGESSGLRNSERFLELFGDELRYVPSRGKKGWLTWDGARWTPTTTRHEALAKEVSRIILAEAAEGLQEARDECARIIELHPTGRGTEVSPEVGKASLRLRGAKASYQFAVQSQSRNGVMGMIRLAQSDPTAQIAETDLDANVWELNVGNGILDLRTGKLRPHDRAALHSKLVTVHYDAEARCPTWRRFIGEVTCGDEELALWLQRFAGYCLTGVTTEHLFAFFYGSGGNGKSIFLTALREILGEYAAPTPRGFLARTPGGDTKHDNQYMVLCGARVAICNETPAGMTFADDRIKDFSSDDRITARYLYGEYVTFEQTHKLIAAGNQKPRILDSSGGMRRRLKLVPWLADFRGREDRDLTKKLREEYGGILGWMMAGCLDWQRSGIPDCPAISKASEGYLNDQDTTGRFLTERLVKTTDGPYPTVREVREAYLRYCEEEEYMPLGSIRFNEEVRKCGGRIDVRKISGVSTKVWAGVAWKK